MRLFFLSLLFVFSLSLQAKELTTKESQALSADVQAMLVAFNQGDASLLIDKTHPSVYRPLGGKAAFQQAIKSSVEQLMASGIQSQDMTVGQPSKLYPAGEEEVCFVPVKAVIKMSGTKMKTTNFMVAIRKVGGDHWAYMDGSAFKDNQDELWALLPQLEKGIVLPKFQVEMLD
jgi:hypothetical protein